ncbi:hypothetical protein [Flavobacterium difficile]|uniref:Uncharacterized protein n=1 Tax=Flavobacterium difficile TaxID=2709659 RepID=A0ABX0I7A6_9FLAO|nr:hypothetical protein [Flavobacterium difficile]NHM03007.1 hypothetical protein [Flavobacterium difficile]
MDELELLKKDWKKNDGQFKQVSENEIYGMLHKSSSSIVKWIFIISIIELLLGPLLGILLSSKEYNLMLERYHLKTVILIFSIINYTVILYFIYKFYTNYKRINATDSVNHLLKNIIDTRKTVKHYITYNLSMGVVLFFIVFGSQAIYEPKIVKLIHDIGGDSNKGYIIVFGIYFVITIVVMFFVWLFYRLIYGILLRRLKRNYNELQKIEY